MNVMGVDFIAPVMMRGAWFWILSRNCWLVFAVVDHAFELYSMTGLTDPSYTVLSICSLAPHVVPASLRIIASFLRAFPSVRKVCVFHVLACSFLHQLVLRTHTFLFDRLIHSYLTASDRPDTFLVDRQRNLKINTLCKAKHHLFTVKIWQTCVLTMFCIVFFTTANDDKTSHPTYMCILLWCMCILLWCMWVVLRNHVTM